MPYIKEKDREKYEDGIKKFLDHLSTEDGVKPGELNYVISSIVWDIFDSNPSYTLANNLIGVLECVKLEFVRRRLNNYEDYKIEENGDLDEGVNLDELLEELKDENKKENMISSKKSQVKKRNRK